MSALLRDAAKGSGWALLAFAATAALYAAEAVHGWEGVVLGAGVAAGAAYWFHRKSRVSVLAAVWFVLAVAGVVAWFAWSLRDFRFQIL
jgi:hypothetical protein